MPRTSSGVSFGTSRAVPAPPPRSMAVTMSSRSPTSASSRRATSRDTTMPRPLRSNAPEATAKYCRKPGSRA